MENKLNDITVSPCETHHLENEEPLYTKRFLKVMKYHEPGIAPVLDGEGAYHIDKMGNAIYPDRFHQTFGFYDQYAAVENEEGWFHINLHGKPLYKNRYEWCGNFQEKKSVVKGQGFYFHIDAQGIPIYKKQYAYVGDFKDGIAVIVCPETGHHTHIDAHGAFVHQQWFLQAGVYHKGYACVKDCGGWAHVNKKGEFIYSSRYQTVEPFYNGFAYVEDFSGALFVINQKGDILHEVRRKSTEDLISSLSSDMVGFWKTWTIAAAVHFKILDFLPASVEKISQQTQIPSSNLSRLLKALWEMGIVDPELNNSWKSTEKGALFIPTDSSFLSAAAQMWASVNKEWQNLSQLLEKEETLYHPSFKELEKDKVLKERYKQAIEGYSQHDLSFLLQWNSWKNYHFILGVGPASIPLMRSLLEKYPHLEGSSFEKFSDLVNVPKVEAILCPRFLHYFPDEKVLEILHILHNSLKEKGELYIMEMILNPSTPMGSLFDLNMFIETGGKVRTFQEWLYLLSKTSFKVQETVRISPVLTILKAQKS